MNEDLFNKVWQFRKKLNLPVSTRPNLLDSSDISFYARFIMEELSELLKAHEQGDLVGAADAIADLSYVTMGCAHHMGLPLPHILDIVHRANMEKTPGATARGVNRDAVKPAGWVGPEEEISLLLMERCQR